MNRKDLARLIKECRPLLKTATPEQKLRMLKLIREGYRKLNQPQEELPLLLVENEKIEDLNADYLEEK
jgi:ssRNA-specific RNase YbeY (16S rRNA maturation enzyme)